MEKIVKEYGDFEVEGELDLNQAKVKVTIYLDGDVLENARKTAKKEHVKYQALINSILRKALLHEGQAEDRIKTLEERVMKLEQLNKVA